MKKAGLLLFLLIILCNLNAQDTSDVKKKNTDTLYIDNFDDNISLWFNTYTKSNNIQIVDKKTPASLFYVPNISSSMGPGFSWKWIALDMSFISTPSLNKSLYGKTEKFDIQSHFHLKKYLIDANLQYYKGFYLNKFPSTAGIITPDSLPYVRPDITQFSFSTSLLYAFSWDKYSLKASFSQCEKQKKSKGTWVLGGQMTFFTIGADSNLCPTNVRAYMDSSAMYAGMGSFSVGIIGGYMYTFVYKNWYLTLSLVPGFGKQVYVYALLNDTAPVFDNKKNTGKLYSRLALGYNGKKFYSGLSIISENSDYNNTTSSYLKHNFGIIRMFVGYRFLYERRKKKKI